MKALMALTGTFEDVSFAELLQLLNVGHKSGRLSVWRGAERAEIFLSAGEVARAMSRRDRGPEVVYRIMGWQAGEFRFERNDDPVHRDILQSTEALMLEGMKRFDEWEHHVESEMPGVEVVLRQRAFAVNEQFDSLSVAAQKVLQLVDARRTVATIIRESGLDAQEAMAGVEELLAEGIVDQWEAKTKLGDVISAAGRLPKAEGAIDFAKSSYFSSKEQLSERRDGSPGESPERSSDSD